MKTTCPSCRTLSTFKYCISKYKYYECPNCEMLFLSPKPFKTDLIDYYKKDFKYQAGKANSQEIIRRSSIILKKLLKLNKKGTKILDIGSGYGYFLYTANKLGLTTSGIEPSKQLINMHYYKHVNTIHNETFESFTKKNSSNKYDFITLIHVIEHVEKPKELISAALRLLNPNGILYVETPNFDSHLYKTERENYTFLTPPDHLWIFSKKSIQQMLPTSSYVAFVATYSFPEHFMGILKSFIKKGSQEDLKRKKVSKLDKVSVNFSIIKQFKYLLFDRLFARLFYKTLNLGYHGSVIELYIKKK